MINSRLAFAVSASVVALLAAVGCGSAGSDPDNTPGKAGTVAPVLITSAASEMTIGVDGGELNVAGVDGGPSYRLSVPAGALRSDTVVSLAPIASLDGFPLSGGLLGGAELGPDGQKFRVPVTLEILLDPASQDELRGALDDGLVLFGFSYHGSGGPLSVDIAEVEADFSAVRLQLTGASGHGAGLGDSGDLTQLGRPSDPAGAAQYDIHEILFPPQGQQPDPNDPAVRADLAVVMREWFNSTILPAINASNDVASFDAAVQGYVDWWNVGRLLGLTSAFWYNIGDPLGTEGFAFKNAALLVYEQLLRDANQACKQNGDIAILMALMKLNSVGTSSSLIDAQTAATRLSSIMSPANFCIKLKIVAIDAPAELEEQATGAIGFSIVSDRPGVNLTAYDLESLQARGIFEVRHPYLFAVESDIVPTDGITSRVEVPVTAVQAVDGQLDEGTVGLGVTVLDLDEWYATAEVTVDVIASPVVCDGSPTTLTNTDDHVESISIEFDGRTSCRIVADYESNDVILAIDSDPGDSRWEGETGPNWGDDSLGKQQPGTTSLTMVRAGTGAKFTVTFTVELSFVGAGPAVKLTVRDVTIAPGGSN